MAMAVAWRKATVNVRVIIVRHGLSCTNALYMIRDPEKVPKETRRQFDDYLDPELTTFGVNKSEANGEAMSEALPGQHIDIVMSSMLTRAAETAHSVSRGFGMTDAPVILCPHLKEFGDGNWNMPRPVPEQEKFLLERGVRPDMRYAREGSLRYTEGDFYAFFKWLEQKLPEVTEIPPPKALTLLIVSHGGPMTKYLADKGANFNGDEPYNNEAWVANFEWRASRLASRTARPFTKLRYRIDTKYPDDWASYCGQAGRCFPLKSAAQCSVRSQRGGTSKRRTRSRHTRSHTRSHTRPHTRSRKRTPSRNRTPRRRSIKRGRLSRRRY